GRVPPEAVVPPAGHAVLVHDVAAFGRDAVAKQEVSIVAAAEETRLLTLRAPRHPQAGSLGLGAGLLLRLLAEREPPPAELVGVEPGEHVRLVLAIVERTSQQPAAAALDDARIVAGREALGAGPLGER